MTHREQLGAYCLLSERVWNRAWTRVNAISSGNFSSLMITSDFASCGHVNIDAKVFKLDISVGSTSNTKIFEEYLVFGIDFSNFLIKAVWSLEKYFSRTIYSKYDGPTTVIVVFYEIDFNSVKIQLVDYFSDIFVAWFFVKRISSWNGGKFVKVLFKLIQLTSLRFWFWYKLTHHPGK